MDCNWKDLNWKYPWSQSLISLGVWHPSSVWADPVYISTLISSHFSTLPSTQPSWPWMLLPPGLCKGSFLSLGRPPQGPTLTHLPFRKPFRWLLSLPSCPSWIIGPSSVLLCASVRLSAFCLYTMVSGLSPQGRLCAPWGQALGLSRLRILGFDT